MKLKFLAAGAALCALGMTGCTNETDEADAQKGKQVVMTMQSATDGPQTRADYTEDGTDNTKMNFSWRSGDKMSVVVDGVAGNENCELATTEAGKSAPFTGTVTGFGDTKTIYAFYPYTQAGYTVTGSDNSATATAALTLPNPQLYTVDGAISNSFMVGTGTATATDNAINASASLKQVMSIIKLNITGAPAKVTGVKLKCSDAIFATTATVKLSDATTTNPGNLVNELSMTVTDNSIDHTAVKAVSFAIFPKAKVDGKKIQIEVTYEGGKSKMIEKDDIALARNIHYVMDFDGTPVATDYIEVSGIKVAVGNLIANGVNSCKIGAPTDGGLYFQFGSLIGWAGGANGDGTGTGNKNINYNASGTVVPVGKNIPTTFVDQDRWTGATGIVPAANDPCTQYLGSDWRLPKPDEYETLFGTTNSWTNGWSWTAPTASATHTKGLAFPASGCRDFNDGSLDYVGSDGYYLSASPNDAEKGYVLYFETYFASSRFFSYQTDGLPVRCVRASL